MRITLAAKILIAVVGVVVLALLSSIAALIAVFQISGLMQQMVAENLDSVLAAEELEIALLQQRGFVTSYVLDGGNRVWLDELGKTEPQFQHWLARAHETAHTPEEHAILARLEEVFKQYDAKRDEAVRYYDEGDFDTAKQILLRDVQTSYRNAFDLCEEFVDLNQRIVQARIADVETQVQQFTFMVGLSVALTIGAGFGLLWLFFRGVLLPLRRMAAEARLAAGASEGTGAGMPEDELQTVGLYLRTLMSDMVETRSHLEHSREQLAHAEKLATVGKLAASVAHEIRNPLTAVKMWLFSIRQAIGGDPELQHKFNIVSEEISRLESIIRNFLQFSRPPKPMLQPHTVASLIDKTLELLAHQLDDKDIHVVREVPALPPVMADTEQVKQVFINLVNNAVEAMDAGGELRITAALASPATDRKMVVIRICDAGAGMPPQVRERIFEPFFTTKEDGTGLGLCIAARIMQRHGGRLVLESSSREGTTFAVWLPTQGAA